MPLNSSEKKDRLAAHLLVGLEILIVLVVLHLIAFAFGLLGSLSEIDVFTACTTARDDVLSGDWLQVVVAIVLIYRETT